MTGGLKTASESAPPTTGDAGVICTTGVSSLAGSGSGALDSRQHVILAAYAGLLTRREWLPGLRQVAPPRLTPQTFHSYGIMRSLKQKAGNSFTFPSISVHHHSPVLQA
jgi:hypothetical protein